MKIAFNQNYGKIYSNDGLFIPDRCELSNNLLIPFMKLKEQIEKRGDELHTLDVYNNQKIDAIIFQDIPLYSIFTISSIKKLAIYIIKRKWRNDPLILALKTVKKDKIILLIMEPPVVNEKSYKVKYYKYFGRIVSWFDIVTEKYKIGKYFWPIYIPDVLLNKPLNKRKMITMICSNKNSNSPLELYSERLKVINYFENKEGIFDLYGFGWENIGVTNYKGTVTDKHEALSNYKFCICFENATSMNGYITEKIFDCFFSGCVPIYYGAPNVQDLIPNNTYINYGQFKSIEEMYSYISTLSNEDIVGYIEAAQIYISSDRFRKTFYYENFVDVLLNSIYGQTKF